MRNGDARTEDEVQFEATVAEIAERRQRLSASIGALKQEITTLTDWEAWIRRKPLQFLGGAFLLGFLLGSRR
jgi:hypothetical protein